MGLRIVREACQRGHEVTAVLRSPAQKKNLPESARPKLMNIERVRDVVELAAGQDMVISALRPPEGREMQLVALTEHVLAGAAQSGLRALIIWGQRFTVGY